MRWGASPKTECPSLARSAAGEVDRGRLRSVRLRLLPFHPAALCERGHRARPCGRFRAVACRSRAADERVLSRFCRVPDPAGRAARPFRPAARARGAAVDRQRRRPPVRPCAERRHACAGARAAGAGGFRLPDGLDQGLHALVSAVAPGDAERVDPRHRRAGRDGRDRAGGGIRGGGGLARRVHRAGGGLRGGRDAHLLRGTRASAARVGRNLVAPVLRDRRDPVEPAISGASRCRWSWCTAPTRRCRGFGSPPGSPT